MSEKKPNAVKGYFVESAMELKKVTWPTSKKAVRLTVVVLSFCLAVGAMIGLVDMLFNFGYGQLLELAGKV
jgi:preprotein translocase SecE subunit